MRFRIIIPSQTIIDIEAVVVTLPGSKGKFGVMPGHSRFITNIKKGIVDVKTTQGNKKFYVHGGVAQVDEDELNILGEFSEELCNVKSSDIKDKINDLSLSLKGLEEESLEAKIIQNKINQFEGLMKHV